MFLVSSESQKTPHISQLPCFFCLSCLFPKHLHALGVGRVEGGVLGLVVVLGSTQSSAREQLRVLCPSRPNPGIPKLRGSNSPKPGEDRAQDTTKPAEPEPGHAKTWRARAQNS